MALFGSSRSSQRCRLLRVKRISRWRSPKSDPLQTSAVLYLHRNGRDRGFRSTNLRRTLLHPSVPMGLGCSEAYVESHITRCLKTAEPSMKYIISWTVPQATFNAAVARFLETGGAPPKGVTMLGRWHGMNGQGFAISESTDAKAMYQWVAQWSDVLSLTVTPCVEDADAGAVMASLGER